MLHACFTLAIHTQWYYSFVLLSSASMRLSFFSLRQSLAPSRATSQGGPVSPRSRARITTNATRLKTELVPSPPSSSPPVPTSRPSKRWLPPILRIRRPLVPRLTLLGDRTAQKLPSSSLRPRPFGARCSLSAFKEQPQPAVRPLAGSAAPSVPRGTITSLRAAKSKQMGLCATVYSDGKNACDVPLAKKVNN